MFGRDRDLQRITGRVLASKNWRQYGTGGSQHRYKYVVEYMTPTGETRRVELKQAMGLNSIAMRNVQVGEEVPLVLHPRSGDVDFDVEDPRIAVHLHDTAGEGRKAENAAYDAALNDGISLQATGPAAGRQMSAAERAHQMRQYMSAMKQAKDAGDQAEYDRLNADFVADKPFTSRG